MNWARYVGFATCLAALSTAAALAAPRPAGIVINEIHYDPADKRPLEFVELHNSTGKEVSLAGWTLEKFTFAADTTIAAGGFVVVAQDPASFAQVFGFRPLGPLPGKLSNAGEKLTLRDADGRSVDAVPYRAGFPWPVAANGAGSSMERIHPLLRSDSPATWRSAGYPIVPPKTKGALLIPAESANWRWRKGTNEASAPVSAWRAREFIEDNSWQHGQTSIGYEDGDDRTVLSDMRGRYSSVFLRHPFVVETAPSALTLRVRVDDGCVAWINGREVTRLHVRPGELRFDGLAENHEVEEEVEEVLLENAAPLLVHGTNWLAIQAFNASRNSSDFTIDAELGAFEGMSQARRPTPGRTNSVFSPITGPAVVDVAHEPASPVSAETVTVTARVTNPDSVATAIVELQSIPPGGYVRKTDAAFQTNWTRLPMADDGQNGDARARDGVFTARVPAEWQRHRHLVRYRVRLRDAAGVEVRLPYEDDRALNFAWLTYDGVPAWTGARRPGQTPAVTFTPEFLRTLPIYHLLAREEDVSRSQWDSSANRRRFLGTLVYDGRVYDHIQFHNRGAGSSYISGKNKWGFKFNRAQSFPARAIAGRPYAHAWDSLNLNPGLSTPYIPVHAGIAGLDEAVALRAFQLAGVPAANSHWIHFRVIDSKEENLPTDQFAGDLRGLYLAVQDMDGTLLRERDLPDGNIYSMQSGRKHLARGAPLDGSDWNQFLSGVRSEHPEDWWRTNLDLSAYYGFHAINRLVANVDLRPDGNHGYYRRPDGRWAPFPWDHDMMLAPRHHQPGHIDAIRCLNARPLKVEFRNRAREILDLFCTDAAPNGGQIGQLVAELSSVLMPAGHTNDWGQLDANLWNWHPRQNQKGIFYVNPATGQHFGGPWKRTLATPDLAGFCRYIVEFCTDSRPEKNYAPNDGDQRGYGFGYLQHEARDAQIPDRPEVRYVGPAGFPAGQLRFSLTPFASPATNRFAVMEWRVGEISAPGRVGYAAERPWRYELETIWGKEIREAAVEFRLPENVCSVQHTYRVRARYRDHTGRASHWSAPVEFIPSR